MRICFSFIILTMVNLSTKPGLNALKFVIMGAPGSGKGSISERIVRDFKMKYLATGDTLRKHIESDTALGKEAKSYISRGSLVPDTLVIKLVDGEIENFQNNAWLLDGFPRTLQQAQWLSKRIQLAGVLSLNVPFEVIIERLKQRWIHAPSGRVYNTEFNPPKVPFIDDHTGEPLTQREDDKPDVVLKRLKLFEANMAPLVNHYLKEGLLKEFKGTSTNEIYPKVKEYLTSLQ